MIKTFQSCIFIIFKKIGLKFNYIKLQNFINNLFILIEKFLVKFDKLIPYYISFYNNMLENEIGFVDINNIKKILHIGCGSIPSTSYYLAKKYKINIIGVDCDLKSVQNVKYYLKKYKFDNFEIKYNNANDISMNNYDLIIISQGVDNLKLLLNNISKNIKKDVFVIIRIFGNADSSDLVKNIQFINKFKIINILYQEKYGFLYSVILKSI